MSPPVRRSASRPAIPAERTATRRQFPTRRVSVSGRRGYRVAMDDDDDGEDAVVDVAVVDYDDVFEGHPWLRGWDDCSQRFLCSRIYERMNEKEMSTFFPL